MDQPKRRRLPSLEPMIEAYSREVWYTIPRARTTHGVDPNAPREPEYFGPQVRLAARVVDIRAGGNARNLGTCDCPPCACPSVSGELCPHDLACSHDGTEDEQAKTRARAKWMHDTTEANPVLALALKHGVAGVYYLARLTDNEAEVADYWAWGMSARYIAWATGRKEGTITTLIDRVKSKFEAMRNLGIAAAA